MGLINTGAGAWRGAVAACPGADPAVAGPRRAEPPHRAESPRHAKERSSRYDLITQLVIVSVVLGNERPC